MFTLVRFTEPGSCADVCGVHSLLEPFFTIYSLDFTAPPILRNPADLPTPRSYTNRRPDLPVAPHLSATGT
ncbi:hypothetical protein H4R33_002419 [Dimargaris cristalligena]|nr:hypothetical protein H4R33_002419 [Dimargaris cristalligena]